MQIERRVINLLITLITLLITGCKTGMISVSQKKQIKELRPLVGHNDLAALEQIETYIPSSATILTSSKLAPWVQGWSTHTVIAPGLLGDSHNFEAWVDFWSATTTYQKIEFLNEFPKPLYLFITPEEKEAFIEGVECLGRRTDFIYEDLCNISR